MGPHGQGTIEAWRRFIRQEPGRVQPILFDPAGNRFQQRQHLCLVASREYGYRLAKMEPATAGSVVEEKLVPAGSIVQPFHPGYAVALAPIAPFFTAPKGQTGRHLRQS